MAVDVTDSTVTEAAVSEATVTDADVTADESGCGGKRKRKHSHQHHHKHSKHSAHEHGIELVMAESLNACGWTKVSIYMLVLFKGATTRSRTAVVL
jgi:hypothetical protein